MVFKKAETKKATKAATKKTTKGGDWERELAEAAEATRGQAAAAAPKGGGGGPRLSVRGGMLSLEGKEVKDNVLECVIVDFSLENAYYGTAFDPENSAPPVCYALGREENEMEPSDQSEDKQNETCEGCPQNEMGSAETGRGKACRNAYRMVLWVPDENEDEPRLVTLNAKLSVFRDLNDYIESCADAKRPYWGVVTRLGLVPARTGKYVVYKLTFEMADTLDADAVKTVKMLRAERVEEMLFADFPTREQVEAKQAAKRERDDSKKPAGRKNKFTRDDAKSAKQRRA